MMLRNWLLGWLDRRIDERTQRTAVALAREMADTELMCQRIEAAVDEVERICNMPSSRNAIHDGNYAPEGDRG